METPPNVQVRTSETSRKVSLVASILMMVLFWIFLAVILTEFLTSPAPHDALVYSIGGLISVQVTLLIPFQLVRYFRELRRLRSPR